MEVESVDDLVKRYLEETPTAPKPARRPNKQSSRPRNEPSLLALDTDLYDMYSGFDVALSLPKPDFSIYDTIQETDAVMSRLEEERNELSRKYASARTNNASLLLQKRQLEAELAALRVLLALEQKTRQERQERVERLVQVEQVEHKSIQGAQDGSQVSQIFGTQESPLLVEKELAFFKERLLLLEKENTKLKVAAKELEVSTKHELSFANKRIESLKDHCDKLREKLAKYKSLYEANREELEKEILEKRGEEVEREQMEKEREKMELERERMEKDRERMEKLEREKMKLKRERLEKRERHLLEHLERDQMEHLERQRVELERRSPDESERERIYELLERRKIDEKLERERLERVRDDRNRRVGSSDSGVRQTSQVQMPPELRDDDHASHSLDRSNSIDVMRNMFKSRGRGDRSANTGSDKPRPACKACSGRAASPDYSVNVLEAFQWPHPQERAERADARKEKSVGSEFWGVANGQI
ncbi:hypothetical protein METBISCDRAFT_26332 [Metschnikowia bicuspidata]|uniref:Uncharacterized protein n=1 Tax=Metschnikowia bicuspidata TaxID=27322 RepID=A0A4P9ZI41_9ASCO|nr:hypothetical protein METBISCDRAFT_26332 [Metschnikowia bicuspidata]